MLFQKPEGRRKGYDHVLRIVSTKHIESVKIVKNLKKTPQDCGSGLGGGPVPLLKLAALSSQVLGPAASPVGPSTSCVVLQVCTADMSPLLPVASPEHPPPLSSSNFNSLLVCRVTHSQGGAKIPLGTPAPHNGMPGSGPAASEAPEEAAGDRHMPQPLPPSWGTQREFLAAGLDQAQPRLFARI